MRKTVPLVTGFKDPNLLGIKHSLPINFYPDFYEGVDDKLLVMRPCPGTERFFNLPSGVVTTEDNVRGMHVMGDNIYAVFGNKLVELLPTIDMGTNELIGFTESELGQLSTDTGPVRMVHSNTNELGIVDGEALYSYMAAETPAFLEVSATTTELEDANDIAFLDNHFIITIGGTSTFYVSSDFDESGPLVSRLRRNISTFEFANITARADRLMGIQVNNLNFYLFGTRVLETWTDAGVALNPFRRINGQVYDYGCAATATIQQATAATGEDITVFLASDTKGALSVVMLGGGGAKPISNPEVEEFLSENVRKKSDAFAFMFRLGNDLFYQITFPTDNFTLVYDFSTNEWHRRQDLEGNRHIANCFVHFDTDDFLGSYNFVGDYQSRRIYRFDDDIFTDAKNGTTLFKKGTLLNGQRLPANTEIENEALPIYKIHYTPWMKSPEERTVRLARVELNCVQGTGRPDYRPSTYTEDENPMISLSASDDKGRTFNKSQEEGVGKIGHYRTRTRYHRFGMSHDGWVFKLESWSKQPIIILSMIIDFEVGNE